MEYTSNRLHKILTESIQKVLNETVPTKRVRSQQLGNNIKKGFAGINQHFDDKLRQTGEQTANAYDSIYQSTEDRINKNNEYTNDNIKQSQNSVYKMSNSLKLINQYIDQCQSTSQNLEDKLYTILNALSKNNIHESKIIKEYNLNNAQNDLDDHLSATKTFQDMEFKDFNNGSKQYAQNLQRQAQQASNNQISAQNAHNNVTYDLSAMAGEMDDNVVYKTSLLNNYLGRLEQVTTEILNAVVSSQQQGQNNSPQQKFNTQQIQYSPQQN